MSLLSALVTLAQRAIIVLLAPLTFLWIIGRLKATRERNEVYSSRYNHDNDAGIKHDGHSDHSPDERVCTPTLTPAALAPRRLSFSTATPATARRRVTFSLTPEQARNERLKTAVRRREAQPVDNVLLPTQYSQQASPLPSSHDAQPQPQLQQVVHLFCRDPPRRLRSNIFPPTPTRRQQLENDAPPVYAADLVGEPRGFVRGDEDGGMARNDATGGDYKYAAPQTRTNGAYGHFGGSMAYRSFPR